MITIIDLNYAKCEYPLISQDLIESINGVLRENKRVLVFLNRRGESNALICKDCSYQAKCSECDVNMNVHKYPVNHLVCHQCDKTEIIFTVCPKCRGSNLLQVGVGIQRLEDNFNKIFSESKIYRLDSDKIKKEGIIMEDIKKSDIIIATEMANTISLDNLGLVVFLLFENEMSIGEYNIEERIYTNISYNSKRGADIIIQTFTPRNNILKIISEGNYKEFLIYTLEERKKYAYPPYNDYLYIWIKGKNKQRISDILARTVNKLNIMNENNEIIINFDKKYYIKKMGEFYQKITLRGKNLQEFLEPMRLEIIRNRDIEIERK